MVLYLSFLIILFIFIFIPFPFFTPFFFLPRSAVVLLASVRQPNHQQSFLFCWRCRCLLPLFFFLLPVCCHGVVSIHFFSYSLFSLPFGASWLFLKHIDPLPALSFILRSSSFLFPLLFSSITINLHVSFFSSYSCH